MPQKEQTRQHTIKVVMIGDSCIGKTAIITRFIKNEWQANYKETVGIEFYRREERLIGKALKVHLSTPSQPNRLPMS
jgi:GTPase SAR1 family protein